MLWYKSSSFTGIVFVATILATSLFVEKIFLNDDQGSWLATLFEAQLGEKDRCFMYDEDGEMPRCSGAKEGQKCGPDTECCDEYSFVETPGEGVPCNGDLQCVDGYCEADDSCGGPDDDLCGGTCDNGEPCRDFTNGGCTCDPIACGEPGDNQCGGTCEFEGPCRTLLNGECTCTPIACGDLDDAVCGGTCDIAGESCFTFTSIGQVFCGCTANPPPCGSPTDAMCGGTCAVPGEFCLTGNSGCNCSVLPLCGAPGDNVCGGTCSTGGPCRQLSNGDCTCTPVVCGDPNDYDPQCGGTCDVEGESCFSTVNGCACTAPLLCADPMNAWCGGTCSVAGETCLDLGTGNCECGIPPSCGDVIGMCQNGACPAGQKCMADPDPLALFTCVCEDIEPACGKGVAGVCGGTCSLDETCVDLGPYGLTGCGCANLCGIWFAPPLGCAPGACPLGLACASDSAFPGCICKVPVPV